MHASYNKQHETTDFLYLSYLPATYQKNSLFSFVLEIFFLGTVIFTFCFELTPREY